MISDAAEGQSTRTTAKVGLSGLSKPLADWYAIMNRLGQNALFTDIWLWQQQFDLFQIITETSGGTRSLET
jgi:hypothetical protein